MIPSIPLVLSLFWLREIFATAASVKHPATSAFRGFLAGSEFNVGAGEPNRSTGGVGGAEGLFSI